MSRFYDMAGYDVQCDDAFSPLETAVPFALMLPSCALEVVKVRNYCQEISFFPLKAQPCF